MGKLFNTIGQSFSRIFRVLLFIISAFLIIYFFPKSGKFKYNFENGRPWQSENLLSPFDFAIKKNKQELENEKAIVIANTPIFFDIDSLTRSLIEVDLKLRVEKFSTDSIPIDYNIDNLNLIKTQSLNIEADVICIASNIQTVFHG